MTHPPDCRCPYCSETRFAVQYVPEKPAQDTRPECIKKLVAAGWKFEWHSEARFVAAVHPLGGKQSVIEVCRTGRSSFDRDEIGQAITDWLNGDKQ